MLVFCPLEGAEGTTTAQRRLSLQIIHLSWSPSPPRAVLYRILSNRYFYKPNTVFLKTGFLILCVLFFSFLLLTHLGILNFAVLWSVLPTQPLPFISSSFSLSVDRRSNRAPSLVGLLITCIRKSRSLLDCVQWHWLPSRC